PSGSPPTGDPFTGSRAPGVFAFLSHAVAVGFQHRFVSLFRGGGTISVNGRDGEWPSGLGRPGLRRSARGLSECSKTPDGDLQSSPPSSSGLPAPHGRRTNASARSP